MPRKLLVDGIVTPNRWTKNAKTPTPQLGTPAFCFCLGRVSLFAATIARWPVVENAWIARPIVAPIAWMHDGIIRHSRIGFAGVTRWQIVGSRVAGRDVICLLYTSDAADE